MQVSFDYPSEYITRVSGQYIAKHPTSHLCSITFHTNKGTYGPYVPGEHKKGIDVRDFNYQMGGKFCGFFGSYHKDSIESIGFYFDPREKLANQTQDVGLYMKPSDKLANPPRGDDLMVPIQLS